ncbi:uncharacterized protein EI90DRAFT_3130414 [Cantharellus anzutake]|uniref:uncharacterized protein n=1 Tax=Cantharellus anzutake TaxID=1750568 RepID=UPI00190743A1|nr:uncharacterized protein EI90DRAFT_3130414 [Cantharellus anzutake]KAF8323547.1 hypothetical protein EI90DRAFT_3130414 [Cantharellus anzutake]
MDRTFYALDWPSVYITKDLLAMRICQISQRDEFLDWAVAQNYDARKKAADRHYHRHAARMKDGDYQPGEFVLVTNERIKLQHDQKGQPRWFGLYMVVKRLCSGAFVLQELDGMVLKCPVVWKQVKLYHFRNNKEPIIREPIKLSKSYEELDNEANYVSYATKSRQPTLPKPWELKGKKLVEYWEEKYERMCARAENPDLRFPPSQHECGLGKFIDEDAQFWDFCYTTQDREDGDLKWFKTLPPGHPDLFDWLPWGRKGSYIPQNSYSTQSDPKHELEVKLLLGKPTIEVIHSNKSPMAITTLATEASGPTNDETPLRTIQQELDHYPLFPFECSMAYGNSNTPHTHHIGIPHEEEVHHIDLKKADTPSDNLPSGSKRQITMALVDNKTAPRRTALPSPRSTSVAPPIQKAAPPTDSSIEPSKMPVVLVPHTPELPRWRQRPGEWTAAPTLPSEQRDVRKFLSEVTAIKEKAEEEPRKPPIPYNLVPHPPHLPFIGSDEDTQDLINQTLKCLNELTDSSFLLKSAHKGQADILFNKLSNLETLTQHINERTVTLMDGFKQTL